MTRSSPACRFLPHVLACAIVAVIGSSALGAGDEEIARFKRAYPVAARQIENRYAQVRGQASVTLVRPGGSERRTEDVMFASLGHLRKFESIRQIPDRAPNTKVVCINENSLSGFTLRQPAGQAEYLVDSIDEGTEFRRSYLTGFGQLLEAPYSLPGTTFVELLKTPNAEVLSAEPIEREGRSLLEVVIQHGNPEHPSQTRALFDPAAGWVARQCQVMAGGVPAPVMESEIEYEDDGVIPPFPKSVTFKSGQQTWIGQFEEIRTERSDPAEFTQAFYGLEPVALPTQPWRPNWNWTWLLGGLGIAAIGAAVLLRWLSNRESN